MVNEVCFGPAAFFNQGFNEFDITIRIMTQPSSFSFIGSDSQLVTLNPGGFVITQSKTPIVFITSISCDCTETSDFQATGTISAGQQLTFTITNKLG